MCLVKHCIKKGIYIVKGKDSILCKSFPKQCQLSAYINEQEDHLSSCNHNNPDWVHRDAHEITGYYGAMF